MESHFVTSQINTNKKHYLYYRQTNLIYINLDEHQV